MDLSLDLSVKELFMKACWRRDWELVRVLLDRGADVNWKIVFFTPKLLGSVLNA